MRRALGLAAVALLVAAPSFAQKVTIDYARDFDFEAVKTFEYVDSEQSNAANPLMADRIQQMIRKELVEGGLTEVTESPDVYVTYHITTAERTTYNTTSFGYGGYHRGWYRWGGGMGSATTSESTFVEGTLIIDAYDAAQNKMIWRGTGTVTVKKTPEKQVRQVEKILEKLGDRWDKILKNEGR